MHPMPIRFRIVRSDLVLRCAFPSAIPEACVLELYVVIGPRIHLQIAKSEGVLKRSFPYPIHIWIAQSGLSVFARATLKGFLDSLKGVSRPKKVILGLKGPKSQSRVKKWLEG